MSCDPNTSEPSENSLQESCEDAKASTDTGAWARLKRALAPSSDLKNANASVDWTKIERWAQSAQSANIGASGASNGTLAMPSLTTGIGSALGGAWPGYSYPNGPSLDDLFGYDEEQKRMNDLMAKLRQIANQKKAEADEQLHRMSKAELARQALAELTKIRERMDVLTTALATICLEQEDEMPNKG